MKLPGWWPSSKDDTKAVLTKLEAIAGQIEKARKDLAERIDKLEQADPRLKELVKTLREHRVRLEEALDTQPPPEGGGHAPTGH